MQITDVRIRLTKKDDVKLKAIASITIDDCFVIHEIRVIEGEKGLFVAMPSRKTPEGEFKDTAHPIKTETRVMVDNMVLEAYKAELAKEPQE